MPLAIGRVFNGRYLIQALLGQGGMGSVYRALDQKLNRWVAIKERLPNPSAPPQEQEEARAQFMREAQTLAALSHLNLPRTYDHFSVGDSDYVIMELIEGQPLDQIIAQYGAINEGPVLAWTRQVLEALCFIHARGIIHRDIKPANLILRSDGKVVLVDFGLVKFIDPRNPRSVTFIRGLGTLEYAPMEQFSPGMHTDARSDIYSLGATMYHLLSNQAPPDAVRRAADPAALPNLRALRPAISAHTESVVQKALALRPVDRWQSAEEMKHALAARPAVQFPAGARMAVPDRTVPTATVFCPQCRSVSSIDEIYCQHCTTKIGAERYCSECGLKAEPGGVFCVECRHRL